MKRLLSLCVAAGMAVSATTALADVLDEVTFETVATGVPGIVGVRHAGDGSGRLFLILRTGQIRIVDASGTLLPTPFLNIGTGGTTPALGFTIVNATGPDERGLLGLAFHPEYAATGKFYIYYLDSGSNTVVAEYQVSSADANLADTSTEQVILRVWQPYNNHNGGDIHFGPDGYLYIGMGDGGSADDPCNAGQSLTYAAMQPPPPAPSIPAQCEAIASFQSSPSTRVPVGNAHSRALLGKMLRIDVDTTNTPAGADLCGADPDLRTYGIPAGNPFEGDTGSNTDACDEIYHYGLRNPWRFSFDRLTDDLIIGDVGQNAWEEVNLVAGSASGLNFGWKICEGRHVRGSTSTLCTLAGRTDPILTYGRGTGFSITGGFRYRGPYSGLDGRLFFADYGGKIFAATENAGTWSFTNPWTGMGSVSSFGEDEAGHLYVTNMTGGTVRRIVGPVAPVPILFEDGFETP